MSKAIKIYGLVMLMVFVFGTAMVYTKLFDLWLAILFEYGTAAIGGMAYFTWIKGLDL